jgi:hypothetical protein
MAALRQALGEGFMVAVRQLVKQASFQEPACRARVAGARHGISTNRDIHTFGTNFILNYKSPVEMRGVIRGCHAFDSSIGAA